MENLSLSDEDIQQIIILSYNYKKDYKEIMESIKKGTTIDELKKQYWQKRNDNSTNKVISEEKTKKNTEKVLKKQYKITDDDIKMCSKYGINDIVEIAMAKDIAEKNNIKLEKVLQIKKTRPRWTDIRKEAGGK